MMLSQSESSIQTDHGIMQNKVKVNQALFLMTDWLYVNIFITKKYRFDFILLLYLVISLKIQLMKIATTDLAKLQY